jgi:hypothetical protein
MPRYLLIIDYNQGVVESPMDEWAPADIRAHMDYYRQQLRELLDSGEMLAGFQLVDVESLERAVEIAARISAVPGPGGAPLQQPITVRRAMSAGEWAALTPP